MSAGRGYAHGTHLRRKSAWIQRGQLHRLKRTCICCVRCASVKHISHACRLDKGSDKNHRRRFAMKDTLSHMIFQKTHMYTVPHIPHTCQYNPFVHHGSASRSLSNGTSGVATENWESIFQSLSSASYVKAKQIWIQTSHPRGKSPSEQANSLLASFSICWLYIYLIVSLWYHKCWHYEYICIFLKQFGDVT